VGVALQIIGYAINIDSVSLAHDGATHCGHRINRCYPGGEDVSAILAELLDSACHILPPLWREREPII
jgi:hypothetical protein